MEDKDSYLSVETLREKTENYAHSVKSLFFIGLLLLTIGSMGATGYEYNSFTETECEGFAEEQVCNEVKNNNLMSYGFWSFLTGIGTTIIVFTFAFGQYVRSLHIRINKDD